MTVAFGIFIHRADSIYDDRPAERYQFPAQYLSRARACIADWIVYYEPVKAPGSRGYFAVARVQDVIVDPGTPGMYLAVIEPGSYLDFTEPVPFSNADGLTERGLYNNARRISGRAQAAIRTLSPADFHCIVSLGLPQEDEFTARTSATRGPEEPEGLAEFQATFHAERDVVQQLLNRKLRDRWFRRDVLKAYDCRCAISGWRLINGGGRAEAEAAHILPVAHGGPDGVRNGLALSGTAHWMFDRGLISLSDTLEILVSRHVNDREELDRIVNGSGRAIPPADPRHHPHPTYLAWHREHCYKR